MGVYKGDGNANFIVNSTAPRTLIVSENSAEDTILDGEGARRGGQILNDFSALVGFTISNCIGASQGGGLHITGDEVFVADCRVHYNRAILPFGISKGGGIYTNGINTRIKDCDIHNNTAGNGGGLYIDSVAAGLKLQNSLVHQNNSNYGGGGVYINGNVALVSNCRISDNKAPSGAGGGGVFIYGDDVNVESCEIFYNIADRGAGLYISNSVQRFKAMNTLVYENEATFRGGGFYFSLGAADASIIHTTIYNNIAPSGSE